MTQLLILIRKSYVNKFGYEKIIYPLKQDLLKLETDGIEISYNNQIIKLRGTISFLVSDNLAANSLAGLIESFGADGK